MSRARRIGAQDEHSVRLEWGPVGGLVVADGCDVAVVVDVLSFTTTLTVAADRGVAVIPCPTHDERAYALAHHHDAELAVRRSDAGPGQVSLSPGTVRAAARLRRLVLPSPNGSTISALLAEQGVRVVGASLRNRRAVAHHCTSGRELNDLGHPDDVDIAAELDRSTAVPVLDEGVFTNVTDAE